MGGRNANSKVGLIGAGLIGKLHAKNLMQMADVELAVISDPYIETMEDWLQSIGISNATENYADILSNLAIEFVRLLRHIQKLLLRQQKQGSYILRKTGKS